MKIGPSFVVANEVPSGSAVRDGKAGTESFHYVGVMHNAESNGDSKNASSYPFLLPVKFVGELSLANAKADGNSNSPEPIG